MAGGFALLCPGQGGQHAQMFDLACTAPGVEAMLAEWLRPALQDGADGALPAVLADPQHLFRNRLAQPLIVAATLAMWQALRLSAPPPSLVLGYSVGELAAYGVAGALNPAQAVGLAATRARLMDDSARQVGADQGVLAVSGVGRARLEAFLAGRQLWRAIETASDNVILAGLATEVAAAQADGLGAKLKPLPIEIAVHTPMMQAAVAPFLAAMRQTGFASLDCPVLAGISAETVHYPEQAPALLAAQVAHTIRWDACMDACAESGIRCALELGPGGALAKMLRTRHPQIECRSVADFRSLPGVLAWLERHCA